MNDQPAGLIGVLLDDAADLVERDDAAMDLGDYDDDQALSALIQIAADENRDEMLHAYCGASIADIWLARRYPDREIYDSLTRAAQNEVYVSADVVRKDGAGYLLPISANFIFRRKARELRNPRANMAILEKETQARPHVVIIGGGFGGLYAARSLAKHPVDITIIDRDNYHLFQPLLYQVATAALSTGDIASPIRSILRKFKNVRVIMGEVTDIDLDGKRVMLEDGDYHYDYLVNAAGARGSYFGHDEWEKYAPSLKTMEDALEIRRRIFTAYETAERLPEESEERDAYLTFVCIGGGPTGVEMAGSIVEVATQTLKADFRSIDPRKTRVILLQSGDRIVPDYPKDLSDSARRQLLEMGVEVRTHSRVTDINADGVFIGETFIPCKTVVWGAGVAASTIGAKMGAPVDRGGRVIVNADMSVPGHPRAFVIGDLANFAHGPKGQLPGVAPVAIQMGVAVAANIVADIAGQPMKDFHYFDKGQIATIGRNSAVGLLFGVHAKGFIAWLMWLLIHIYFLVGFENRAFVMFNWIWSYLSYNRSARLITDVAYKRD